MPDSLKATIACSLILALMVAAMLYLSASPRGTADPNCEMSHRAFHAELNFDTFTTDRSFLNAGMATICDRYRTFGIPTGGSH